jgi:hypothetical protein
MSITPTEIEEKEQGVYHESVHVVGGSEQGGPLPRWSKR